jgi:L-ascorbate metabolism protein UlaG (beta-lactamase superfamily)
MLVTRLRKLGAVVALTLGAACGHATPTPQRLAPVGCEAGCGDTVKVQFLGAAGFLIRHGDDAVLTAPYFSNSGFAQTLFGRVRPNSGRIARGMAMMGGDTAGIRAILVGHAHIDHLMDVPDIALRYLPGMPIYGSGTMKNVLAASPVHPRLRVVNDSAGTDVVMGRWIYPKAEPGIATGTAADSTVRFMPIAARHPFHAFRAIKLFRGHADTPYVRLPRTAREWKEGNLYAYVIEFRDPRRDSTLYRIHFSDAPAWRHEGFPPPALGSRYDLALLCVGGYHDVRPDHDVPTEFLRTIRPRHVILGHWESFFSEQNKRMHPLPTLKLNNVYVPRVVRAMGGDANAYTLPEPGDSVKLCVCGGRGASAVPPPSG